jgi:hypothetical protein
MIFFSTGKLRKRNCFGPIRTFFSTAQTEKSSWKKLVKQIVKKSNEFITPSENDLNAFLKIVKLELR